MKYMNTQELIDKLTKAISFQYKTDKTTPGLQIASLKNGYYASIVRYNKPFGKDKSVVCKARADSLNGALKELAFEFMKLQVRQKDPVDQLNDFLNKNSDILLPNEITASGF